MSVAGALLSQGFILVVFAFGTWVPYGYVTNGKQMKTMFVLASTLTAAAGLSFLASVWAAVVCK